MYAIYTLRLTVLAYDDLKRQLIRELRIKVFVLKDYISLLHYSEFRAQTYIHDV